MARSLPLLAASLAAALPLSAPGLAAEPERWVAVEESDEGTMFFDRESAERIGAIVRFTMRFVRSAPNWRRERSVLLDSEIDCAAQTDRIRRVRTFGPQGEALRRIDASPDAAPQPLFADRGRDSLYRLACPDGPRLRAAPPAGPGAAPGN